MDMVKSQLMTMTMMMSSMNSNNSSSNIMWNMLYTDYVLFNFIYDHIKYHIIQSSQSSQFYK